jgi:ATP-dependent 26S proteasome regulatory subunit
MRKWLCLNAVSPSLQLLVSLDGFSGTGQVVTICATNRVDTLDRALTRPGRFDRKLCVELPGFEDRIKILKVRPRYSEACRIQAVLLVQNCPVDD